MVCNELGKGKTLDEGFEFGHARSQFLEQALPGDSRIACDESCIDVAIVVDGIPVIGGRLPRKNRLAGLKQGAIPANEVGNNISRCPAIDGGQESCF